MKVSGFTFIRNAIKFDYPIVESIKSILPLCDEYIVVVGNSQDETLALIEGINSPKIKIIHSIWDDSLREGGKVLAVETDKALAHIAQDSDWAFYLQGDEIVHEQDLENIKNAMLKWKDNTRVEGLLFDYTHFYGSYKYVGDTRRWYRKEIRIVRPHKEVFSYKDAQGFRIKPNRKLRVKKINAKIYHYGWVKSPQLQLAKIQSFHRLWYKTDLPPSHEFSYEGIDSLVLFEGIHPSVMHERVKNEDWVFEHPLHVKNFKTTTEKFLNWFEKNIGYRIGEYKNYRII